jgi:hypothetical protein
MGKRILLAFLVIALFSGCNKLDPKIEAPAYLEIDNYSVITDTSTQGTNDQYFTDVLILASGQNYGYYPIPCKIPLPFDGEKSLIIRPTIKVNGVGAIRIDYPLFKGCDTDLVITRGQVKKFTPTFKYYPSVNFRFLENFDKGTTQIKPMVSDTFCYSVSDTDGFRGNHLVMKLDASHPTFTVQSTSAFYLPTSGPYVYLEMNYKSNVAFEAGLIGTSYPQGSFTSTDFRSAGGANATTTWKKLYIDLTPLVRTPPAYPYFYLYFYAIYSATVPTTRIYIDNIKVISQS